MRMYPVAILASLLLASCAGVDRGVKMHAESFAEMLEVAGATVEYRDRSGAWPASPKDLKPLLTDQPIDAHRLDQHITFRTTPRGLAVVDRKTNKTAIIIGNESTRENLVLTTGE